MLDLRVLFESCEHVGITDCTGGSSAVTGVVNQIKISPTQRRRRKAARTKGGGGQAAPPAREGRESSTTEREEEGPATELNIS